MLVAFIIITIGYHGIRYCTSIPVHKNIPNSVSEGNPIDWLPIVLRAIPSPIGWLPVVLRAIPPPIDWLPVVLRAIPPPIDWMPVVLRDIPPSGIG